MKKCEWCENLFESKGVGKHHKKFCSEKCGNDSWYNKNSKRVKDERKLKRSGGKGIYKCATCGKDIVSERKRQYCSPGCRKSTYAPEVIEKKCVECGNVFGTTNQSKMYCSVRCNNKHQNRNKELARRFKVYKNGFVDKDISLEKLIIRDDNTCHLCLDECCVEDHVITKEGHFIVGYRYPSIDHVVAIANGGTHTWDNVRLAHHYCNTIKRDNKIIGEQTEMTLGV